MVNDYAVPKGYDVINDKHKEPKYTPGALENYTNMKIGLPRVTGDELYHAEVRKIAAEKSVNPVGVSTINPLTKSSRYGVELLYGTKYLLVDNVIAENLLAHFDKE